MQDTYFRVIQHPAVALGAFVVLWTQFFRIFWPVLYGAIDLLYAIGPYG